MTTSLPPIPSLAIEKRESMLDGIVLLEYFPIERVDALLKSEHLLSQWDYSNYSQKTASQFYENEKKQLIAYKNNYKPKLGGITVKYNKAKHKWGRVFPMKSLGLTSLSRKTRNTFIEGLYYDFDLKNAQPRVIQVICKSNNIDCPLIDKYCAERDSILEEIASEYSVSKGIAKRLMLRLCFFGTFRGWCFDNKIEGKFPTSFIIRFEKELRDIADKTKSVNSILYETCRKLKEAKKEKNYIGSFYAQYLQEYETRIVESVTKYLMEETGIMNHPKVKTDVKVGVYEFDGVKLLKSNVDKFIGGRTAVLELMNQKTLELTGFDLLFEEKEIEDYWDIKEWLDGNMDENFSDETDPFKNTVYLEWKRKFELEFCKIKNTANFIRTCHASNGTFQKYVIFTEKQLKISYNHETFETKLNKNGRVISTETFISVWLADPNMKCYEDADIFPPPLVCPPNIFNMWRPFPFDEMDELTEDVYDKEGVEMFFAHLQILCNHEQVVNDYVCMWLAHMIQKPSEKSTHLILISEEGAGKSTFINTLSRLLGAGKVLETTEPEKNVWGPFNSLMINAFLVVLSEVDKRNSFSAEGRIKALITDPTLTINCKGKDQFEVRSCHRFISATNGLDPLVTHKNDRRNVIIRCSDEKVGDFEYFKKLATKMENPITLRSIYYKLKNQELGDWNFRDIPKTQFHENIVEGNKCPLESFMEYFTSKHLGTEFIDLYGKNMYENFEKWKEDYGYQRYEIKSSGELIKRLKNNLKLPNGAIISLPKDRNGIQQRYDINILKKAFNLEEGVKGVCLIPLPPEEDVEEVEDVEASLVMIKGKKYYTCENDIFKYNEDEIGDKVGYYSNGKAIFL